MNVKAPRCAGLVSVDEGRRLGVLAAHVRQDLAIVELGTHTGLSACWMAAAAAAGYGAHVTAIDPWGDPRPGSEDDPLGIGGGDATFQRFVDNVTAERHWGQITPLRGRSTDLAPFWVQPAGLVFIDAVHEKWAVEADYAAWAEHIAPGGWLAFHDYTPDPDHAYAGVGEAIAAVVTPTGLWSEPDITGSLWTARRLR